MTTHESEPLVASSRRDVLKASGAAAIGLGAFFANSRGEEAGAATEALSTHGTTYATTAYVATAVTTLVASERRFNVVTYGADPTGVDDSSAAITKAQRALKLAGGGELFFPPGGRYRFATGIITRTKLADVTMSINATGSTLLPFGSGVAINTQMSDPAYWAQPITPPMSPVVFSVMDCTGLTSGGVGVRHSNAVGAYYDGLVHNAAATPDSTWPFVGRPGARGWQLTNSTDTNGVARWTEQTVFGPNAGVHNCYVGIEFDAATGTNSFGYTRMIRFVIECSRVRQRGVVVRGSGSVAAQLYGSHLNWQGNNGSSASVVVGTIASAPAPATAATAATVLSLRSASTSAVADGEIVILKDAAGHNPQAVMVRGPNPLGTSSIATYRFAPSVDYTGGTIEVVPAGCVIGWPGTGSTGWSTGTSTDSSNLRRSSLQWNMEGGGSTLPVRTCSLFVGTAATFSAVGYVDLVTYSTGLVQNYGTLNFEGAYEGHVTPSADLGTTYLGASAPDVNSVCLGQSFPRILINDETSVTMTSGQPLIAALTISAGVPIRYLGWYAGASGATNVTNHWLALLDQNFHLLATTNDLGSTISPRTTYGGAIARTAAGAATSYTPSTSGVLYLAIGVVADVMPSVTGIGLLNSVIGAPLGGGPLLGGVANAFFTTPPSFPTTFVPTPGVAAIPYVWVAGTP